MFFSNRKEAGVKLAHALQKYAGRPCVVLALPRGGVVLGAEIAAALKAPLDLLIPMKIGHPENPEYAIGAVTETGEPVFNPSVLREAGLDWFNQRVIQKRREAKRRREAYRGKRSPLPVEGKTVILVDDGIATGWTMRAAIREVRRSKPARVVVAIPVVPGDTAERLRQEVDVLVALDIPEFYAGAVGAYYEDFGQVDDEEVTSLIEKSGEITILLSDGVTLNIPSDIPSDGVTLNGTLILPPKAIGVVLFAHGSGSSRLSLRNRFVAEALQKKKTGTLLFDLLTEKEDEIYRTRFNIDLLTKRLLVATRWIQKNEATKQMPIGYFGTSTGAAAALMAAAALGEKIRTVVSRGGRPDLAGAALEKVISPTLLIVGGEDTAVLQLNRQALEKLDVEKRLAIVPKATHLFEEPGALEEVARLAAEWFKKHLAHHH